ncbi:MAG: tetratricopeptide repeat protein [Verrucomicrobia bacterium]|nr:tetratricopeptide repeat protein [Verrucomicrobiota bacterium]
MVRFWYENRPAAIVNEHGTSPASSLQSALDFHREGRFAEAETLYLRVLAELPRQPDALRLLGILARQRGDFDRALDLLHQALAVSPASADAHHDVGLTWFQLANYSKAIDAYQQALQIEPRFAEAKYNLGNAYYALRDLEAALACFQQARKLQPGLSEVHFSLGLLEQDHGHFSEAILNYERAIQARPDYPEAFLNMGLAWKRLGRSDLAKSHLENSLKLRPKYSEALLNHGIIHQEEGRLSDAAICFRSVLTDNAENIPARLNLAMVLDGLEELKEAENEARDAVERAPENPQAHALLGALLIKTHHSKEAKQASERALAIAPNFLPAHVNLAQILLIENRLDEAAIHCEQVLRSEPLNAAALVCLGVIRTRQRHPREAIDVLERALKAYPDDSAAEINLAICELLVGRFHEGWRHYDARWRSKLTSCVPRSFSQQRWRGEGFSGRTLLIHAEQGFGDTIQFARYAAMVKKRGGRVVFECQPSLKSIIRTVTGIDKVIGCGEELGEFELHVPLLSLPEVFRTHLETIPAVVPYLSPPEIDTTILPARRPDEIRVGFVWRGSKSQNDDQRPVPLTALKEVFEISGIRPFSFQIDSITDELENSGLTEKIFPLGNALSDFGATAAFISEMDLMVTMDTAVTHLAGALGKPTFVLLPFAPDWRWLLDREDSPWYPSFRLFRQIRFGDWSVPVKRLTIRLREILEKGMRPDACGQESV